MIFFTLVAKRSMPFNMIRLATIIALGLHCFNAAAQTPAQFNEHISSIADSLYKKGNQWGAQLNDAYASKTFSKIVAGRKQWETFVNASISELQNMKDATNSKALRMTMLNFLFFEREMISEAMLPIEKLSAADSDYDIQKTIDNLTIYAEKEVAELKKVRGEQEKYAISNGLDAEPAAN